MGTVARVTEISARSDTSFDAAIEAGIVREQACGAAARARLGAVPGGAAVEALADGVALAGGDRPVYERRGHELDVRPLSRERRGQGVVVGRDVAARVHELHSHRQTF